MRYVLGMLLGIALSSMPSVADAGNARAAIKQVESTLLVTGTIVIAPDGTVRDYKLDDSRALGESLEQFLDASIRSWRFQPVVVDGAVVTAEAPMRLRLVANGQEDGGMRVRIAATWFDSEKSRPRADASRSSRLRPPGYPMGALRLGAQGIVYVVLRYGRDGRVQEAGVERVNLRTLGTDRQMSDLRKQFEDAALRAARTWTFLPPATGKEAEQDNWLVRVPVDFRMTNRQQPKPWEWQSYVPDPTVRDLPWAREQLRIAGSPEALPDSGVYPLERSTIRLLNAPGT
ncbi:protein tonB [Thermomonas sp.]|uniref:protein tonB n=1 Tax=Thermomonas sp. TaxID=1971895 RepID=UPI002EE75F27